MLISPLKGGAGMHLKESFKTGLITLVPLALFGWVIYSFIKVNNAIWTIVPLPESLLSYRWAINILMSLLIIVSIGLIVRLLHPVEKILKMFPFLLIFRASNREKATIVRIEWGKNKFLGWLDEITVNENEEKEYKVTVPSAPLPLSAQIMFATVDKIELSNLTTADLLKQLASLGLRKLPPGTRFFRDGENCAPR